MHSEICVEEEKNVFFSASLKCLLVTNSLIFKIFIFLFGFTAHQDFFTHFEPSQSLLGQRREIPEKNHLTTRKQNLLVSHVTLASLEPTAAR